MINSSNDCMQKWPQQWACVGRSAWTTRLVPVQESTWPREVLCSWYMFFSSKYPSRLRIVEQAAGHLRWTVDYPPPQPVGSGFEPHWRPQPA